MIQAQCPTTPPLQSCFHNADEYSPFNSQRSDPPSSSVASSPSGVTSDGTSTSEMAIQEIAQISRKAQQKFLPYPRPNIIEALELCFMERSLTVGPGNNIGHGDAKAVFLPLHLHCRTGLSLHRGELCFSVALRHCLTRDFKLLS